MINTRSGIHLYASRYDSLVVPQSYNNQLPKFDLMVGPFPNMEIPAGEPNNIELAHIANPDIMSLMYLHISGEPATGAGPALPWGDQPDLSRLEQWEEVNRYEEIFFHSADPANLTFLSSNKRVKLCWSEDKRNLVFPISGYNVYRADEVDGLFQKLNTSLVIDTEYTDRGLVNEQVYYYQIKSVADTELSYSGTISAEPSNSPPTCLLYAPEFSIICDSNDGFHPSPSTSPNYIFSVSVIGCPMNIYLNFAGNKYPMEYAGDHYEFSLPKNVNAGYYGGFQYFFEADDGTRLPETGVYTTNINNRVRCKYWGNYLTDPTKIKELHATWITDWINEYGYDGVFYDLAVADLVGPDAPPLPYPSQFIQDKKELIQHIRDQDILVFYNRGWQPDSDYSADGAMLENFAYRVDKTYQIKSVWEDQINFMINSNDAVICLAKRIDNGDENYGIQPRMYSLCSYLLGKGEKSYFACWPIGTFLTVAEYFIDIGEPVQFGCSVDAYYSDGIYKRHFTKGVVIVNPDSVAKNIDFCQTYFNIEPTGGSLETVGGNLTSTPVTSMEFLPNTGAILLLENIE